MSEAFPLDGEPAADASEPAGTWRLTVREHAAKAFATPPGGLRFATLLEAKAHADGEIGAGRWRGCSVWVLNDGDGELHARQPDGTWYCTRQGNVRIWMAGKRPYRRPVSDKLGSGRVDGRAR